MRNCVNRIIKIMDPLDAYDAVYTAWQRQRAEVNETDSGTAPFFVSPSGGAWTTSDTSTLAKAIGTAAGIPPKDCGAKAFRIGGATDMRQAAGEEKAMRLLKERVTPSSFHLQNRL